MPQPVDPSDQEPSKASTAVRKVGRVLRASLLVIVSVFATLFLLANTGSVEVNYIVGQAEAPLFLALALALLLGMLITLIAMGVSKLRNR